MITILCLIIYNCNKSFKIDKYSNKKSSDEKEKNKFKEEDDFSSLLEEASNGNIKKVKELLDKGANPNIVDNIGNTPLMLAAHNGHKKIVKLLLIKGANLDTANIFGDTALTTVVFQALFSPRCEGIVKLLLNAGTRNIDFKNGDGRNSLMIAVSGMHVEIVKLLLKKGANPNVVDNIGNTSLMRLCINKAIYPPYQLEIAKLLIKAGTNINAKNIYEETALMNSVSAENENIVCLLLNNNIDDINAKNNKKYTALLTVACRGHKKIVKLLLNKDAKIDILDIHENILLTKISKFKNKDIIELLLSKGIANIEIFTQKFKSKNILKIMIDDKALIQLLLHKDEYPNIGGASHILKAALNSNEKMRSKAIEQIDIIKLFSYDSFLNKSKSLLIESFFNVVKLYELEKIDAVKEINEFFIISFIEYCDKKIEEVKGYEEIFLEKLTIIKNKINIFIGNLYIHIKDNKGKIEFEKLICKLNKV